MMGRDSRYSNVAAMVAIDTGRGLSRKINRGHAGQSMVYVSQMPFCLLKKI
jgi:hypothetical protein